jgi:hypothetical protein
LGTRGLVLAIVTAAAVVAVPAVVIAATGDGGTLTLKSRTTASSSSTTFTVVSDAANALTGVTITCTSSKAIIPLTTLTYAGNVKAINPPTFSGCTDTLSGTDTVATNHTNGAWKATYNDVADSGGEALGASGDTIGLSTPKAGLTVISSAAPTCQIVADPSAANTTTAGYNDATGSLGITSSSSGNPFPFVVQNAPSMTGCPILGDTGTADFAGTYTTNPILTDS